MIPSLDYQDAGPKVCRRCGVRSADAHETPAECIDALRTIIAKLQFRQDQHAEKPQCAPRDGRGGHRNRADNRMVVLDGERLCLTAAARRLGISTTALHFRIVARTKTKEYSDVDLRAISVDVLRTGARQ